MIMKKFFRCEHCGNFVGVITDAGVPMICCGEPMKEVVANTTDAATEKHVPVVEVNGDTLTAKVGSVTHPMEDAHYIQWITLQTKQGSQIKYLQPGQAPKADFALTEGDEVVAVFAYCNLHGLWKA